MTGEFRENLGDNEVEVVQALVEGEDKPFNITEFLQQPKDDYSALIRQNDVESDLGHWEGMFLFTQRDDHLAENLNEKTPERKKVFDFVSERLSEKMLVDLGAGRDRGRIQNMAQRLGAKIYIGVDKFFPYKEREEINSDQDLSYGEKQEDMQVATIKGDMLDFLSRLPDNSVCITMNGIDIDMVTSEAYINALVKEIIRVLHPSGIAFGTDSTALRNIAQAIYLKEELEYMEKLREDDPEKFKAIMQTKAPVTTPTQLTGKVTFIPRDVIEELLAYVMQEDQDNNTTQAA